VQNVLVYEVKNADKAKPKMQADVLLPIHWYQQEKKITSEYPWWSSSRATCSRTRVIPTEPKLLILVEQPSLQTA
jgi:hypothetical protein